MDADIVLGHAKLRRFLIQDLQKSKGTVLSIFVNERVVYRATQGTVGASGMLVDYVKCRGRVECQVKFGCRL
jgi:hypothetical protein